MDNPNWYKSLNKSKLTPPDFVFSIVWNILYLMITISFIIYIRDKPTQFGIIFFIIQIILNLSWSPVFFGFKNIKLAFYIIILLVISLFLTIINFYKTNKLSSYLLLPYLLWVLLAIYLNYYIIINN